MHTWSEISKTSDQNGYFSGKSPVDSSRKQEAYTHTHIADFQYFFRINLNLERSKNACRTNYESMLYSSP